jgi:hypothetical protein
MAYRPGNLGYGSADHGEREGAPDSIMAAADDGDPNKQLENSLDQVSRMLRPLEQVAGATFSELDIDDPESRRKWENIMRERRGAVDMLAKLRWALFRYSALLLIIDRESDEYHSVRRQIDTIDQLISPEDPKTPKT